MGVDERESSQRLRNGGRPEKLLSIVLRGGLTNPSTRALLQQQQQKKMRKNPFKSQVHILAFYLFSLLRSDLFENNFILRCICKINKPLTSNVFYLNSFIAHLLCNVYLTRRLAGKEGHLSL